MLELQCVDPIACFSDVLLDYWYFNDKDYI